MNDVIKKLVEIEDQAKKFSKETETQKEKLLREIEEEKQSLYQKYITDAKKKVDEECESVRKEAEKEFAENQNARDASVKKLEEYYNENRDKWVKEIIGRVLA